ncbi:hypothetical protein PG994_002307 [Apiospora phragmitis]|uniref:Uncharacterized protein n=1 Tax=Apiospora phragmitis TaxID=2905665 RepID=A0ABR1WVZ8_9PEZI
MSSFETQKRAQVAIYDVKLGLGVREAVRKWDATRSVNGATVANINVFFDRFDAPELANIPPERHYNTDEMGIGQGVGGDHWVVAEATSHIALKKDVEKGEWITALDPGFGCGSLRFTEEKAEDTLKGVSEYGPWIKAY